MSEPLEPQVYFDSQSKIPNQIPVTIRNPEKPGLTISLRAARYDESTQAEDAVSDSGARVDVNTVTWTMSMPKIKASGLGEPTEGWIIEEDETGMEHIVTSTFRSETFMFYGFRTVGTPLRGLGAEE